MIEDLEIPGAAEKLESIEEVLLDCASGNRGVIDELTGHLANAGGKRLRPLLTVMCAEFGPNPADRRVVTSGAIVELTHLASLYHDDVMDSAPTRRGAPSAQHLWGNNRAILAGDVLFAAASELIADFSTDVIQRHARSFTRMCVGQLNESFGPEEGDDPVEFYIQVLADKTGALVAEAAAFGAIHAGAEPWVVDTVEDFGEKIGVAFQIADDVIDLDSEGDVTGKTPGTDLREGVDTLPVLLLKQDRAKGRLDARGSAILDALEHDLTNDEDLAVVVEMLRAHPVLERTRAMALEWAGRAVDALKPLPEGPEKRKLEEFAAMMVDRVS